MKIDMTLHLLTLWYLLSQVEILLLLGVLVWLQHRHLRHYALGIVAWVAKKGNTPMNLWKQFSSEKKRLRRFICQARRSHARKRLCVLRVAHRRLEKRQNEVMAGQAGGNER